MIVLAWLCAVVSVRAVPVAEMQTFPHSRYLGSDWSDGDSFLVELEPGREQVVRLYFVDCPETTAGQESDQRRLREQSAHFGVEDPKITMEAGRRATKEVAELLAQPFTVHTAFTSALGRSAQPRVYAFVTTADGKDLGEYLVTRGLARSYGVGRTTPNGISVNDAKEHLDDLEMQAALQKTGLWAQTNPGKLASLREARREEIRQTEKDFGLRPEGPINANTATIDEMVQLPGVGPVLAERIVDGRPYTSVEDLRRVPGLGPKTFERLQDLLKVTP